MKIKKWTLVIGLTIFLVLTFLAFTPTPNPAEKDCLHAKGFVTEISESGTKDIAIKLRGVDKTFYVNRGLERGLDLADLRTNLLNKEILIKYPSYWTPLDPTNSLRHVSKIELNGHTIFTELGK